MITAVARRPVAASTARAAAGDAPAPATPPKPMCCPTTVALSPEAVARIGTALAAEYRNLSWGRDAQAKGEVAKALAANGTTAAIEALAADFRNLSWSRDADAKRAVMEALVTSRHDLAEAPLTESFKNLSWSRDFALKLELLQALRRLATPRAVAAE